MIAPTVIMHIDDLGYPTIHASGDGVTVLVIDERAPDDRVFRLTARITSDTVTEMVGDSEIGYRDDERFPGLEAAVRVRHEAQRPKLVAVNTDTPDYRSGRDAT